MPRVKAEYKAERRAHILTAARTCFARDGFHHTTLQDVFAEAGLSAGCVYNYFQSKDDLILAIAEERHRSETEALAQRTQSQDPVAALRQIAAHFVDSYLGAADGEKRQIAIQTWSEAMLSQPILASVREGLDVPKREISALIRRAQNTGQIQASVDPDATARAMIALFHGFVLQKLWEPKLNIEACAEIFERFLDSLRAPDAARKKR